MITMNEPIREKREPIFHKFCASFTLKDYLRSLLDPWGVTTPSMHERTSQERLRALRPDMYSPGPVHVYTKEEIDKYMNEHNMVA